MLFLVSASPAQYRLKLIAVDKDSLFVAKMLQPPAGFPDRTACSRYIGNLPAALQAKGYPTASVDSVWYDTAQATVQLYTGLPYQLTAIHVRPEDKKLLEQVGWNEKRLFHKPLNPQQLRELQEKMLEYFEDNGYPFARIRLDSMIFTAEKLEASLETEKGPLYKIDSIRVYGPARINNVFLQRYLDIKNGSPYRKSKLQDINKRLLELPYLQQQQNWTMTMLGTGSVINLYLQPKKSSQINALIGFLPANQYSNNSYEQVRTKLLFTGEANINLRNALGNGELIGVNWQQLQQKSPRLNLQYQQPYLWGSPFGITTSFDLFKKDSAYLNLNFQVGVQYALSVNQTGKVFLQTLRTNLLSLDTGAIKASRRLPNEIDLSSVSLGVDYEVNKTNYRLNPRRGYELQLTASAGTRTIRKNNIIVKLYGPGFSFASLYDSMQLKTYQFRLKAGTARYFPLGRQSVLKAAFNGAWLQSPAVFRNELFQIGGYKLMRGFDEESIFASGYAIATAEYRYIVGLNSFFFVFTDLGWSQNHSVHTQTSNSFLGMGGGMAFETKAGVFNISYATGKRNDLKFDLRQSKIHIGYINYF
jgi:outer membrane protein assembly factor BamA